LASWPNRTNCKQRIFFIEKLIIAKNFKLIKNLQIRHFFNGANGFEMQAGGATNGIKLLAAD
jgi:hypothetical protein